MTDETPPPSGETGASSTPAPSSPAPIASDPAPAPAASPASTETPPASPDETPAATPPTFKLPDAYKDKPWAAKIKSEDDLYKQLDNLNQVVGKKIVVPDLTKASDAEREEYYAQLRPPSKDAYEFGDATDPAIKAGMAESLYKNGVSATQANAIIKDYVAAEEAIMAEQYKPEVIEASMKKQFGDDWKTITGQTRTALRGMMTPTDFNLVENLPNAYMAVIYRTLGNVVKRFGVKEGDTHVNSPAGGNIVADVTTERQTLRGQIAALAHKPHTAAEKQALINRLNATYQTKA